MARFDLQGFKKQASFFLREKLNGARLALTDVSRIQLLTEEATNEDPWGPETRTMATLADAAFELEEYERIVQVIHSRLDGSKKRTWRQLYKTLLVLEYLLTHGPNSLSKEFVGDVFHFEDLSQFTFVDQQGIDRGSSVRRGADKVLELLNDPGLRREERARARNISFGIRGFGSRDQEPATGFNGTLENSTKLSDGPTNVINWPPAHKYEKSPSMLAKLKEDLCKETSNQETWSGAKPRPYMKSLSSPSHFRELSSRLSWQPTHEDICELEEVECCLTATTDQDTKSQSHQIPHGMAEAVNFISDTFKEQEFRDAERISTPACEDSLMGQGDDLFSLVGSCKTWHGNQQESVAAYPQLRSKFQQPWQQSGFMNSDVKFGKAV